MRFNGGWRSENAGMSNRNAPESGAHRKPKVSSAMTLSRGLGGPKGKARAVPNGQPVNIPAHPLDKLQVTQSKSSGRLLDSEAGFSCHPEN